MNYKFGLIATAALLMACSSDNDTDPEPQPQPSERRISVVVGENPMIPEGGAAKTRAAVTTTSTLSAFNMHGIYNNLSKDYNITKSNNNWTIDPNTWPDDAPNETKVPFYAHTSYIAQSGTSNNTTFQLNSGDPYVSFTVPEDAFNQHDLLVANTSASYTGSGNNVGTVHLVFDHACATVTFKVRMTEGLQTALSGGKTLTVNTIKLYNAYNTGKYNYKTGWYDKGGSAYYTLNHTSLTNLTTTFEPLLDNQSKTNYLFMIPQKREPSEPFNPAKDLCIEVKYTISGGSEKTAYIPLNVDWKGGYEYLINIQLGTLHIEVE